MRWFNKRKDLICFQVMWLGGVLLCPVRAADEYELYSPYAGGRFAAVWTNATASEPIFFFDAAHGSRSPVDMLGQSKSWLSSDPRGLSRPERSTQIVGDLRSRLGELASEFASLSFDSNRFGQGFVFLGRSDNLDTLVVALWERHTKRGRLKRRNHDAVELVVTTALPAANHQTVEEAIVILPTFPILTSRDCVVIGDRAVVVVGDEHGIDPICYFSFLGDWKRLAPRVGQATSNGAYWKISANVVLQSGSRRDSLIRQNRRPDTLLLAESLASATPLGPDNPVLQDPLLWLLR
jgi:hypothetical protein